MIILDKKLVIAIFVFSLTLFFTNLSYGEGSVGIILFWIAILGMMGSVIYQILHLEKNDHMVVLFEVIIINICLHLVFQVGFIGLNSRDSYDDLKFLEYILNNHFFSLNQDPGVSGWPLLHVFSASIIQTTGLDHFQFVKYFASFFTSLIVIFLYILTNTIYKNKKVALMAPLIFVTIPKFMIFESFFIREIMGLFTILVGFYLVYASKNNKDVRLTVFAIVFFVLIVLAHHFSSFMFLVLLFLFFATSIILPYIYKHPHIYYHIFKSKKPSPPREINVRTVFTIAMVILLAYWLYCSVEIWTNVGQFFANLITLGELPSYSANTGVTGTVVTLKGKIIFYGFFIYMILFSVILLIKLRIDQGKTRIEDLTFTFFLFFCGGYGLLSVYAFTSLISPDRLLTHGWLFGVIPLVGFLLTLKNHSPIYKKVFFALLISFMIFNLFNIQQEYINKDYKSLGIANEKEYALAETIIIPESNISSNNSLVYEKLFYGYEGSRNALYDEQYTLGQDSSNFGKKAVTMDKIVIINEPLLLKDINIIKIKNPETYQKTMDLITMEESYDKVGDLGNGIYVLFSTK
ncbi:MAG: hypothetical protein KO316_06210 [Methanobacterium sp.]|jgi:hypothetical protein|nr:hypothetical protein [Methanobacterium sp.]